MWRRERMLGRTNCPYRVRQMQCHMALLAIWWDLVDGVLLPFNCLRLVARRL